jgi:hypothetical protein
MTRRSPSVRALAALAVVMLAPTWAGGAQAVIRGSTLALPLIIADGKPRFVLAQRSIERSWGPSEDSAYTTVDVPGWKSEGLAAGLSAVVPGAGQLYAGERSGFWYALAEVAGWTANRVYVHRAQVARDHAARFAGDPTDTTSAWSFARWTRLTGLDPGELASIWERDRPAFYHLIATDPTYLVGWSGQPDATRLAFSDLRGKARGEYLRANDMSYVLWLNHLVAALDALHAARVNDLVLRENLELKLHSSWKAGRPGVMAVLVRRF